MNLNKRKAKLKNRSNDFRKKTIFWAINLYFECVFPKEQPKSQKLNWNIKSKQIQAKHPLNTNDLWKKK